MQIFVRSPNGGATRVFDCNAQTRLADFIQWYEDMSGWPSRAYYILFNGRPLPHDGPAQERTFAELNVERENTFHLMPRFRALMKN
jgi:hypothetical protein